MKQTIEQAVASVKNAPGSMYTREDVISLLNKIEVTNNGSGLTEEQIRDLIKVVVDKVRDNTDELSNDCVDKSSAEFSLNYNEIELDSVDFDTSGIRDAVTEGIGDEIESFFEQLKEDEEEEEESEEEELPEEEIV
tara:strand:- start:28 stop:435 length:408 start_codon:yes stop_codon:yes gene_type:complete